MAIFVTTLDNVLIFSKGFVKDENVERVEYKDNKELSYMTKQALDILKSLNELLGLWKSINELLFIQFLTMLY